MNWIIGNNGSGFDTELSYAEIGRFSSSITNFLKQREKWLNKTNYTIELIQMLHTLVNKQIEMIVILQSMAKTPELLWLENKLLLNDLSATGGVLYYNEPYRNNMPKLW